MNYHVAFFLRVNPHILPSGQFVLCFLNNIGVQWSSSSEGGNCTNRGSVPLVSSQCLIKSFLHRQLTGEDTQPACVHKTLIWKGEGVTSGTDYGEMKRKGRKAGRYTRACSFLTWDGEDDTENVTNVLCLRRGQESSTPTHNSHSLCPWAF